MLSFVKQVFRQHFLIIACAVFVGIFWPQLRQNITFFKQYYKNVEKTAVDSKSVRVLTADDLAKYDGILKPQIYLSLLGTVYDVTKGTKHYGTDGAYSFFAGIVLNSFP